MALKKTSLSPSGVHVWLTDTSIPLETGQIDRYRGVISSEELEKADRYLSEKDRHSSLVTRALVRFALSSYAPVLPEEWRFVTNSHGRPKVAPGICDTPLVFNLSHTDGLVVCAVALGFPLGVDVEKCDRDISMSVAERFFAPEEVSALEGACGDERRSMSLDIWTLKESYVKARGMGLSIPLSKFWFSMGRGDARINFHPGIDDNSREWKFFRYDHKGSHKIAVAVKNSCVSMDDIRFITCLPNF